MSFITSTRSRHHFILCLLHRFIVCLFFTLVIATIAKEKAYRGSLFSPSYSVLANPTHTHTHSRNRVRTRAHCQLHLELIRQAEDFERREQGWTRQMRQTTSEAKDAAFIAQQHSQVCENSLFAHACARIVSFFFVVALTVFQFGG